MADILQTKTEKLIKYGNEKFGLNETTLRGVLDNASGSEDLSAELNAQDELLTNLETEINGLPEAGGGETTAGDYFVKVIDYDGTVLKEAKLNTGDTFTLPNAPTHDGLVFQEWSCSQDIVDNTITVADNNVIAGAVYTTASGLNEFDIELTKVTGLDVTLNMNGTKDWGDGTSDDLTTHTYTNYGKYTIKCDGTTMATSSSSGLFGQSSNVKNYYCISARLNLKFINNYAFTNCYSLKTMVISNKLEDTGTTAFSNCKLLSGIVIPDKVPRINTDLFGYCYSLTEIIIPKNVTKIDGAFKYCSSLVNVVIPNSVTKIGDNATFDSCYSLTNIILPKSLVTLSVSFNYCYSLKSIVIPESIGRIPGFRDCYSLTSITLPENATTMSNYAFTNCHSLLNINLPENITSISSSSFSACHSLLNIKIPKNVTSISNSAFSANSSITIYDFSTHTTVPTLSNINAFNGINSIAKIVVPDALYNEWIVTTNWVTYADYIYKTSEVQ